jgi:putative nucleotidyltransferase with HDIG domain
MASIDAFLDGVKDLPPAPRILPELMLLLNQPDIDSSRVVNLLSTDPGLTTDVLRLCNSAFLGGSSPAEDLQEALTRLGFRQVYQLVAVVSGARALTPPQTGYGLAGGELWKHCVTAALGAQLVARDLGDDESVTFTAGLLHDVGKIVLSSALTDKHARILEETEKHQRSMHDTERLLLGFAHAEVGARLLERWKLPTPLVAAVRHHHTPADADTHARLTALVYLGNMIAHCMGYTSGYQSFALHGRAEVFDILQLDPQRWPLYLVRAWQKLPLTQSLLYSQG